MFVPSGKYAPKTEYPADEVNSTTRTAPSMHSNRGPLFRTPLSVVFPEGPEIVHCDPEEIREDSAFRAPQVNTFVPWVLPDWPRANWPCAGVATTAITSSKPALFIWPCYQTPYRHAPFHHQ